MVAEGCALWLAAHGPRALWQILTGRYGVDPRHRSKRFATLAERAVNRETFVHEWPEVGLIAMDSPLDPTPSLQLAGSQIVEMDGRRRDEFDLIDRFIADNAIDAGRAEETMATDSLHLARMLVDIATPRDALLALLGGCTPAKLV